MRYRGYLGGARIEVKDEKTLAFKLTIKAPAAGGQALKDVTHYFFCKTPKEFQRWVQVLSAWEGTKADAVETGRNRFESVCGRSTVEEVENENDDDEGEVGEEDIDYSGDHWGLGRVEEESWEDNFNAF